MLSRRRRFPMSYHCRRLPVQYDDALPMQFKQPDALFNVRRFALHLPLHLPLHVAFVPADALSPLFHSLHLRLLLRARVDALKSGTTKPQSLLNAGVCLSPCDLH